MPLRALSAPGPVSLVYVGSVIRVNRGLVMLRVRRSVERRVLRSLLYLVFVLSFVGHLVRYGSEGYDATPYGFAMLVSLVGLACSLPR